MEGTWMGRDLEEERPGGGETWRRRDVEGERPGAGETWMGRDVDGERPGWGEMWMGRDLDGERWGWGEVKEVRLGGGGRGRMRCYVTAREVVGGRGMDGWIDKRQTRQMHRWIGLDG